MTHVVHFSGIDRADRVATDRTVTAGTRAGHCCAVVGTTMVGTKDGKFRG